MDPRTNEFVRASQPNYCAFALGTTEGQRKVI